MWNKIIIGFVMCWQALVFGFGIYAMYVGMDDFGKISKAMTTLVIIGGMPLFFTE